VLYSHKWTPDAYLLAKAYIAEDDKKDDSDTASKASLPKIPMKQQTRKLLVAHLCVCMCVYVVCARA
jgi:hypothetical protein